MLLFPQIVYVLYLILLFLGPRIVQAFSEGLGSPGGSPLFSAYSNIYIWKPIADNFFPSKLTHFSSFWAVLTLSKSQSSSLNNLIWHRYSMQQFVFSLSFTNVSVFKQMFLPVFIWAAFLMAFCEINFSLTDVLDPEALFPNQNQ